MLANLTKTPLDFGSDGRQIKRLLPKRNKNYKHSESEVYYSDIEDSSEPEVLEDDLLNVEFSEDLGDNLETAEIPEKDSSNKILAKKEDRKTKGVKKGKGFLLNNKQRKR
jgi:hypothetical protein